MPRTKIGILKQYLFMALLVVLVRVIFRFVFGDRSSESLVQAISQGCNLAMWVLGFGFLNLVLDFRKLLSRLPQSLRKFTTPLGIAISLTPEMAKSMIQIRENAKLRAHRRGLHFVRSVLVPMVSSAIDQALNLAESMQARGFAKPFSAPSGRVNLKHLSFGYPNGKQVLNDVSIELPSGSFTLITGATGSGKSTLLKVIQAKLPGVGFVGQFARQTFVAETVFDELAFSLKARETTKGELINRVKDLASKFDLDLSANPFELSAGWQQRLAIAAALSAGSRVLILDEPFSALDESGTSELLEILAGLKAAGITIVIAEHRDSLLEHLADRVLRIQAGSVFDTTFGNELLRSNIPTRGKVTVLLGKNGSGKTTHLRKLASASGVLVPQPASDLLFLDSVEDEFRQSDIDAKQLSGTTEAIAKQFKLDFVANQNPRDLSEGQKLTLALAIQLARKTNLLLLDEPTLGFDIASRQVLAGLIKQIAESGVAVLIATHDREFSGAIATETIRIEQVITHAN